MKSSSNVLNTLYNDWKQKSQKNSSVKLSFAQQLILRELSLTSQQFHETFLYGQKMVLLHKGKPKQMFVYLDNNRQKILWISSKTKAFLIDLYFTCVAFKQSNQVDNLADKKYYFSLKQLDEEVVFIFDKEQQKNKYFNLFQVYIGELKRIDPKYNLYFSNVAKLQAMSSTKNGTNQSTFLQIMEISKQVGLTNRSENQQILNTCLVFNEVLDAKKIPIKCVDDYFKIQFCNRSLQPIFEQFSRQKIGNSKKDPTVIYKKVMSRQQFQKFLQVCQKQSKEYIKQILKIYPDDLSFFDFCRYLYDSQLNHASRMEQTHQNYPLKDYFCYSSHNTYLSGNQINSDCRAQRYSQDLQNGIKCVELDVHDRFSKLVVTHAVNGAGFCKPVSFEDVIKVIQVYSAKCKLQQIQHYPIILSIQNHASNQNKQNMLDIMTRYFGKKIYLLQGNQTEFPTLQFLSGKIVIKTSSHEEELRSFKKKYLENRIPSLRDSIDLGFTKLNGVKKFQNENLQKKYEDFLQFKRRMQKTKHKFNSRHQQFQQIYIPVSSMAKITTIFKSKDGVKSKDLTQFQCTSLTHEKVNKMNKQQLIRYTQKSWLRTYPLGTEIASANYDPISMMAIGAQIVALNTQTKDEYAWLTNGYFCGGHAKNNSRRGYVLKPQRLLHPDLIFQKKFYKLKIQVIESNGETIKMRFFGLAEDMKRNNIAGATQFIYQNPDQSFIMFDIGVDTRQCIAIRWIVEGYRIIQGKLLYNFMDCGKRILIKIVKNVLD